MRNLLVISLLIPMVGCEYLEKGQDIVEGLTNPLVVQGMVLGISPPDSEYVDLSQTDFQEGTAATLFLADASTAQQIEEAPVEGATISLEGEVIGSAALGELGAGAYMMNPSAGVTYEAGAQWTVQITGHDEEASSASLVLPAAVSVVIPAQHTANTGMTLDLSAGAYDSALVVVLDGQSGEVTYSNQPEDVMAYYEFTHGTVAVTTVEIPATAFPGESVYAVGVAGMNNADSATMVNMNTVLSAVMVGRMGFSVVSTMPVTSR